MSKTGSCFKKKKCVEGGARASTSPPSEYFVSTAATVFLFMGRMGFCSTRDLFRAERHFKALVISVISASLNLTCDYLQSPHVMVLKKIYSNTL